MKELIFSLFLIVFSWQDYRRKRIRISWLCGYGLVGIVFEIIHFISMIAISGFNWKKAAVEILMWLLSMLPGLFLLFIERRTNGAVGCGDGIFFMITGCYLGVWYTCNLLIGAVFVSSMVGAVWMILLLISGKGSALWEKMRRKKLPFLPCLLPVWMCMLILRNV